MQTPLPPVLLSLRVRAWRRLSPQTAILELDLAGGRLPYRAGQGVAIGLHGQTLRKHYSLATAPEDAQRDDKLELLVKTGHAGDPGAHLQGVRVGDLVEVTGPFGAFAFPDAPSADRMLFIAGGTGIAPMRAMLRHALAAHPDARITLVYSVRDSADFAFTEEFGDLARSGRIEFEQTVTRTWADEWTGRRGRIEAAHLAPFVHEGHVLCFVCGPHALTAAVVEMLLKLGVAHDRILREEWGS